LTVALDGDSELRLTIWQDLRQRMDQAQAQEDVIGETLTRLQGSKRPCSSKRLLWVGAAVVCLWLAAVIAEMPDLLLEDTWVARLTEVFNPGRSGFSDIHYDSLFPEVLQGIGKARLRTIERRAGLPNPFWDGNGDLKDHTTRLHEQFPDSPAIYYAYVSDFRFQNKRLPDDFDQVWQRIDPENGAWLAAKAAVMAQASTSPSGKWEYTVTNRPLFQEAVVTLDQALRMPRFQAFRGKQMELILNSVGQPHSYAEAKVTADLAEWLPRAFWPGVIANEQIGMRHSAPPEEIPRDLDRLFRYGLLTRLDDPDRPGSWWEYLGPPEPADRFPEEEGKLQQMLKVDALSAAKPDAALFDLLFSRPLQETGKTWFEVAGSVRQARLVLLVLSGICLAGLGIFALLGLAASRATQACAKCVQAILHAGGSRRLVLAGILAPLCWTLLHALWLPLDGEEGFIVAAYVAGTALAAAIATLVELGEWELERRTGFLGIRRGRNARAMDRCFWFMALLAPVCFWLPMCLKAPASETMTDRWHLHELGLFLSGLALMRVLGKTAASLIKPRANLRRLLVTRRLMPVGLGLVAAMLTVVVGMSLWEAWIVRQPGLFEKNASDGEISRRQVEGWQALKKEWYGD
jgi:hypothetical protein